jgi:Mce-associated membrane protein
VRSTGEDVTGEDLLGADATGRQPDGAGHGSADHGGGAFAGDGAAGPGTAGDRASATAREGAGLSGAAPDGAAASVAAPRGDGETGAPPGGRPAEDGTPPAGEPGTDDGSPGAEPPRKGRPRLRTAVAIALLLALAGGALQVMAWRARHVPATRNRALVDTETTALVIGDVGNGLSKVFSYAPGSTAATEQAAADVLGGAALTQYRTLFAQVKRRAAAEGLTVTTHVVRAGVTDLSGRTAHVLVFLDQIVVRRDRPQGTPAAAQLSVTAHLDAGHWRIVDIHAL